METGFATVGSLSTFKLINPVKVWGNLLPFNSPGIKTTNGINEFRIAHEKLNEGKGILFDVISLMTIGLLGLADLIDMLPNAKAVSQSTLDHINELIRDTQFFADGSSTFLPFEDTFILHEESPEQIANRKNLLHALHQWITDKFQILPCNEAKNMLLQDKQYLDNLIGESFAESLLTAKEKGYLIYAEEWNVRALGNTEYGLDGVYSFALLGYLSDRKVITAEKYQELVISLISLNYKMLPTDSAVIMRCFEIYKDVKHPVFLRSLGGMYSEMFTNDQALIIAVQFFFKLWNNPIFDETYQDEALITRKRLMDAILNVMYQCYEPYEAVQNNLKLVANGVSPTYPKGNDEIQALIDDFFNRADEANS
jgi:hypothetical protein